MSNQSHFTLAQALIIAALLLVTVGLALPIVQQQREYARRRMCGSNLNSLTKAMMIYASWALPRYDSSGTGGHAVGFREGDRRTNRGATLTDNVTAVLWMLVRDGTLSQNAFVCPSTDDRPDPLTIDGTDSGPLAVVDNTWDFYAREHLSYSIVNVYSPFVDWAESMPSAYVMFGDNNNNDWQGMIGVAVKGIPSRSGTAAVSTSVALSAITGEGKPVGGGWGKVMI